MPLSLSDVIAATPVQVNPHFDITTSEIEDFCHRYQIWLPHFDEYHNMTAYMFPRASSERLVTITIVMNLLWFIDDYYTRSRINGNQTDDQALSKSFMIGIEVLLYNDVRNACETWHYACIEIRQQIINLAGEAWLRRLISSLNDHLQATTYSISRIMVDGRVNVAAYIEVRELDAGMHVVMDCIEFSYGMQLSSEVLAHPTLMRMRRDCANVAALLNDVVSFHKETRVNDGRFNLLSVLMESNGITFDQAVHEAILLINGFTQDFLDREQALPQWGDPVTDENIRQYVEGMKDQIGASLHWQLSSNRYRASQSPFAELRQVIDM